MNWFSEHLQEILSIIGFIVWLVRLEGKTNHNDKRLAHVEAQVENLESGLVKEMTEVKQALARIEGYLKAKAEEKIKSHPCQNTKKHRNLRIKSKLVTVQLQCC